MGRRCTLGAEFGGEVVTRTILFALATTVEIATQCFSENLCEITDHTDVNGNVILLRGTGEREGVILPDRNLGAAQEDVLGLLVYSFLPAMGLYIPGQPGFWCSLFLFGFHKHC